MNKPPFKTRMTNGGSEEFVWNDIKIFLCRTRTKAGSIYRPSNNVTICWPDGGYDYFTDCIVETESTPKTEVAIWNFLGNAIHKRMNMITKGIDRYYEESAK